MNPLSTPYSRPLVIDPCWRSRDTFRAHAQCGEDACEPSFSQVIPYQDTGTARHFCQEKPRYRWSVQSQMPQEDGSQFVRKYSERTGSDRLCGY